MKDETFTNSLPDRCERRGMDLCRSVLTVVARRCRPTHIIESLIDPGSGKTQQKETAMLSFTSLTASLAQGNGPSLSSILILILGLLVAMVVLAIMAPRLRIPYPILLVLGGLLIGFVPGLPRFTSNPDIVFLLFLPPLLYS